MELANPACYSCDELKLILNDYTSLSSEIEKETFLIQELEEQLRHLQRRKEIIEIRIRNIINRIKDKIDK